MTNQLIINRLSVAESLSEAWNVVCRSYQQQCADDQQCAADYDPLEGTLDAYTGSDDLVAGTTASFLALDFSVIVRFTLTVLPDFVVNLLPLTLLELGFLALNLDFLSVFLRQFPARLFR